MAPQTTLKVPCEDDSVEEEQSNGIESVPSPLGASEVTEGPTPAQSNQPVSHQSEQFLFSITQQMTQNMANRQADSSSEASRPSAFENASMKAPHCIYGTRTFKVGTFIQS
ncbi:hypothetical protein O181_027636 [Austropuccinia psidii MF-1]|uniref:Uncharacterized protein n=1 Tax=Austropuccinia psidii MF-1 TaxID=1389203 RepID=A0A9Q3CMQ1_9BASI|nr:hypothetical protein [Austropuccinia psidii MF-1]